MVNINIGVSRSSFKKKRVKNIRRRCESDSGSSGLIDKNTWGHRANRLTNQVIIQKKKKEA